MRLIASRVTSLPIGYVAYVNMLLTGNVQQQVLRYVVTAWMHVMKCLVVLVVTSQTSAYAQDAVIVSMNERIICCRLFRLRLVVFYDRTHSAYCCRLLLPRTRLRKWHHVDWWRQPVSLVSVPGTYICSPITKMLKLDIFDVVITPVITSSHFGGTLMLTALSLFQTHTIHGSTLLNWRKCWQLVVSENRHQNTVMSHFATAYFDNK